jgi:hypothetical protein
VLDAPSKVTGWWLAPGHSDPLSLHRISSDVMTGRPPSTDGTSVRPKSLLLVGESCDYTRPSGGAIRCQDDVC